MLLFIFSFSYDLIRFDLERSVIKIKPVDMSYRCLHCNEQCERDSEYVSKKSQQ